MSYEATEDDRFWRTLHATRVTMQKNAPEGYIAQVEIHLRDEVIVPAIVQSIPPWRFFEVHASDKADHRVIGVRAESIVRAEIRYVREAGTHTVGFEVKPPTEGLGEAS